MDAFRTTVSKSLKSLDKYCDVDIGTTGYVKPSCMDLLINTGMTVPAFQNGDTTGAIVQGFGDIAIDTAKEMVKKPFRGMQLSKAAIPVAEAKIALQQADEAAKMAIKAAEKATQLATKLGTEASQIAMKSAIEAAEAATKKVTELALVKASAKLAAKTGTSLGTRIATGLALAAPSGPIGWIIEAVIIIFQVTGMLIDMLWDPFKTYFNKDLDEMKQTIDASIRKQYIKQGYEYPLEIKPNILPQTPEQEEQFQEYMKKYYIDHSLISPKEAASEEELWRYLSEIKRNQNVIQNIDNISFMSSTQQSIALLAAVAIIKRNNAKLSKAIDVDYKTYIPDHFREQKEFVKYNWQIIVSSSLCICLICFCIIFLSSTSN